MKISVFKSLPAAALLLIGCAAHTSLAPLGQGRLAPNIGIGGPIVEAFGTHVPIPYLLAGADYGISGSVNANAAVHLLPLAYGVAGLDAGATWFPFRNDGWRPAIGLGPRIFLFASLKRNVESRFFLYPAVSASASWKAGPGLLYTGGDLALPLSRPEYDEEAESVIFSPFIGIQWNIGGSCALFTELKWNGANIETDRLAVKFTAVGNQGAVTPLVSIQRRF
jgi:hypothetical protein